MYSLANVYLLCFLTCVVCTVLLIRGWWRSRIPLLLWTAVTFVLLSLNNLLLFVDLVLLPEVDLSLYRVLLSLSAVSVLLYGFIWEVD